MPHAHLWATIGRLIDDFQIPAPTTVDASGERLTVKLHNPGEVDAWAQHIGMPPANEQAMPGVTWYGSCDFLPAPNGWMGYRAIYVYCHLPKAVT